MTMRSQRRMIRVILLCMQTGHMSNSMITLIVIQLDIVSCSCLWKKFNVIRYYKLILHTWQATITWGPTWIVREILVFQISDPRVMAIELWAQNTPTFQHRPFSWWSLFLNNLCEAVDFVLKAIKFRYFLAGFVRSRSRWQGKGKSGKGKGKSTSKSWEEGTERRERRI